MSTAPSSYTIAQSLAIVFGTPPFGTEYTTDHIRKVLGKLLDQTEVLLVLRTAEYATPRPGKGKHLLKWRFSRADLPNTSAAYRPTTPTPTRRNHTPRRERPVAQGMKLKP